jgi:GMP synthase-like glutamine amidotransferase
MRAHFLQHVPFEGPGSIEPWLKAAGLEVTCTRFFESTGLPDLAAVDLLIVMGGPMSVNDESRFPWLRIEKQFVRSVIDRGTPVLGVCLGAQLIAGSLGASVGPNPHKEIGWFPVHGVPSGDNRAFRFPSSIEAFHWHGETFDLPPGAVRIAQGEGCENQGFQFGPSVIGLQFHLETTPVSAREIVRHCRDELQPGRYVQSEEQILEAPPERYDAINRLMNEILSFLCGRAG